MNVILYERAYDKMNPASKRRDEVHETLILEDDGSPDGKLIATVKEYDVALQIVKAMGWNLVEENRVVKS